MLLSLVGALDMRAFYDVSDDGPNWVPADFISGKWPAKQDAKRFDRLKEHLAVALGCDPREVSFELSEASISRVNLFGKPLTMVVPESAKLLDDWRVCTESMLQVPFSMKFDSVQVEPNGEQKTIVFNDAVASEILGGVQFQLTFEIYSIGVSLIRLDVSSTSPLFGRYWCPLASVLEYATYHVDSVVALFAMDDNPPKADAVARVGAVNESFKKIRDAFRLCFSPRIDRLVASNIVDEVDSGFYIVVTHEPDGSEAEVIAIMQAANEREDLAHIKSDGSDSYVGWYGACTFAQERSYRERGIENGAVCNLVFSLLHFYERHLTEYLVRFVFRGQSLNVATDIEQERRFGDAIIYLADLRRASMWGSDRRFIDAFNKIGNIETMREKVSKGVDLVISRIEDRERRRREILAKRFTTITALFGLASILGSLNTLRSYLTSPSKEGDPPSVFTLHFASAAGKDILIIYFGFGCIFVLVWLFTVIQRKIKQRQTA